MSERIKKLRICNRKGIHTCRLGSIHLNEREAGILTEYLTQLQTERDEAVRRAVEGERERIIKDIETDPEIPIPRPYEVAWIMSKIQLADKLTPPSDISSEGNSK